MWQLSSSSVGSPEFYSDGQYFVAYSGDKGSANLVVLVSGSRKELQVLVRELAFSSLSAL